MAGASSTQNHDHSEVARKPLILGNKDYKDISDEFEQASEESCRSWVYSHGVRMRAISDGRFHWLCSSCYKQNVTPPITYSLRSTDHAADHLKIVHSLKNLAPKKAAQSTRLPPGTEPSPLDKEEFKRLFTRWVVTNSISFCTPVEKLR